MASERPNDAWESESDLTAQDPNDLDDHLKDNFEEGPLESQTTPTQSAVCGNTPTNVSTSGRPCVNSSVQPSVEFK